MLEERFRLIYLSKETSDIKQMSLTGTKFKLVVSVLGICLIGVIIGGVSIFNRLFNDYRIITLQNDKEFLEQQLLQIKEKSAQFEATLADVQTNVDMLRKTAGLEPASDDERMLGVGGPSGTFEIGFYSDEIKKTAGEMNNDLAKFTRDLQYEMSSLNAVAQKLREQRDRVEHSPSIMPIVGSHITSKFGWRDDPFTQKPDYHKGIDLAGNPGTQVHVTAAGIVTDRRFSETYGNIIEVDHGNGLITKYAHLSSMKVRVGQKVKRWDIIGTVGNTGRSEAPHLHYEVVQNSKVVDPTDFIFN